MRTVTCHIKEVKVELLFWNHFGGCSFARLWEDDGFDLLEKGNRIQKWDQVMRNL